MGKFPINERKRTVMKLILASASPRRKEILTTLGVEFTVRTADADESCELSDPGARVEAIALKKPWPYRRPCGPRGLWMRIP